MAIRAEKYKTSFYIIGMMGSNMAPEGGKWYQEGENVTRRVKYGTRRGNMAPGGEIWHQKGENGTRRGKHAPLKCSKCCLIFFDYSARTTQIVIIIPHVYLCPCHLTCSCTSHCWEIWHQEGKYGTRRGNMAPEGGK